jgi:hypothetical protein
MDLTDFEHTKKKVIYKVYGLYLAGYAVSDIRIVSDLDDVMINNIIDCCNYLNC